MLDYDYRIFLSINYSYYCLNLTVLLGMSRRIQNLKVISGYDSYK